MIRRFILAAVTLHALYVAIWLVLDGRGEKRFESEAVRVAITVAFVAYVILAVAYLKAKKSRLNSALAVNKLYWAMLIGGLFLPRLWWDSGWNAPGWARVYLWVFLTLSILGVLREFYVANWGHRRTPTAPQPTDQVIGYQLAGTPVPPERSDG